MGRKNWVGGAIALLLAAAGACLVSQRLGGFALILVALGAVAFAAFRLL